MLEETNRPNPNEGLMRNHEILNDLRDRLMEIQRNLMVAGGTIYNDGTHAFGLQFPEELEKNAEVYVDKNPPSPLEDRVPVVKTTLPLLMQIVQLMDKVEGISLYLKDLTEFISLKL